MSVSDLQHIGVLARQGEANGKENVFINRSSAIQYMVKSLLLPDETGKCYTGYMDSFESNDEISDDEYWDEELRVENFRHAIEDKLFVFFGRQSSGGEYQKMFKVNLIEKPVGFDKDIAFFSVPVFAAANDKVVMDWENEMPWNLYREYDSFKEFIEYVKNKKPVGRIYGYDARICGYSFVIWKDSDGKLYAIGNFSNARYNTTGGLILETDRYVRIDLSAYIKYIVYNPNLNPTLIYIPDIIYRQIGDELLKSIVSIEKSEKVEIEELETDVNKISDLESNSIDERVDSEEEVDKTKREQLLEIDTSIKTDKLIIQSMDYHSQKRNLFYSVNDLVNVHTAIKCSNLVILSGLSGTGKSALVDIYARALGINYAANAEDSRLLFIPVRPSWNDDADLLGYVDLVHMVYRASDTGFVDFLVKAQKEENKNKMFLVCFDEMNLARVEHYFSQFLSILERPVNQRELQLYENQYSGRLYNSADYPSRIKIGDNIRFIGTVNVDESTYHFSDKVLDRANVIQLDVLNYADSWVKKQYGTLANIVWSYDEYQNIIKNVDENMMDIQRLLWELHQLLQSASTKYGVGPRIVKAIELYLVNLPSCPIGEFDIKLGLDYQIAQRVLTKVRGPESQLGGILDENSDNNFIKIFDKYDNLSEFNKCRAVVKQKQKELVAYGYCI